MLGHSMGSFLTRTYLILYPGTLDGVILSGTGQEKGALVAGGKALASLLCTLRGPDYVSELVYGLSLGGYGRPFRKETDTTSWLSRDRSMVEANLRDPLCTFHPTVSMFRDMLGGIQFIGNPANLTRMDLDIPVYFFSGDRDPVGSMGKGVRKVEKLFGRPGAGTSPCSSTREDGTRCSTRRTGRRSWRTCWPGWRPRCARQSEKQNEDRLVSGKLVLVLTGKGCYASTLPTGKAARNRRRTRGPAIKNWTGRAMMKLRGILRSQFEGTEAQAPVWKAPSQAP